MSTCQGAPAPHRCEHGDRCDWTPIEFVDETLKRRVLDADAAAIGDGPGAFEGLRSFLGRFEALAAGRMTKTPARALAAIEKLETSGVSELGVPVFVWPGHRGRVTGFFVACEEHGIMPFLAPSKLKGEVAAKRHIVAEHRRAGSVVHTRKAPNLRVAS